MVLYTANDVIVSNTRPRPMLTPQRSHIKGQRGSKFVASVLFIYP